MSLAFAFCLYGLLTTAVGMARGNARLLASARGAGVAVVLAVVVASLWLWHLLLTSDFHYAYVVAETSLTLPPLYKFAAFWSGFAGSLLLWVLILSLYFGYQLVLPRREARPLMPGVSLVLFLVLGFFLFLLVFQASPFTPAPAGVLDGAGLNPLLQFPEMAIHPLLLYAGFTGMAVPFAFGMATLLQGRPDRAWLLLTRRTTLMAWLFLTAGILMGMHWSYRVLGWGGYWAWDPVENASFLPWLTGTAFLHSAVVEDRRGSMRGWNVVLVVVTFLLTLFGTFITRSGIVASIHAFTDTTVWPYFLAFLGAMALASAVLLAVSWRRLGDRPVEGSLVSKDTAFLFNNILLLGATIAILWGTVYPLVTALVSGQTITAGVSFFDAVFAPIALALIVLMGIGPELKWRQDRLGDVVRRLWPSWIGFGVGFLVAEAYGHLFWPSVAVGAVLFALVTMVGAYLGALGTWRRAHPTEPPWRALAAVVGGNRRRYGGYLVHMGVLIVALGIIGTQTFQQSTTLTLRPGQAVTLAGYRMTLEQVGQGLAGPYPERYATLKVQGLGGTTTITPSSVSYPQQATPMGRPAIWSTPLADVYAVLSGAGRRSATLLLIVNPLVSWIWFGGLVTVLGILVALAHGAPEQVAQRREAALAWRS